MSYQGFAQSIFTNIFSTLENKDYLYVKCKNIFEIGEDECSDYNSCAFDVVCLREYDGKYIHFLIVVYNYKSYEGFESCLLDYLSCFSSSSITNDNNVYLLLVTSKLRLISSYFVKLNKIIHSALQGNLICDTKYVNEYNGNLFLTDCKIIDVFYRLLFCIIENGKLSSNELNELNSLFKICNNYQVQSAVGVNSISDTVNNILNRKENNTMSSNSLMSLREAAERAREVLSAQACSDDALNETQKSMLNIACKCAEEFGDNTLFLSKLSERLSK